MSFASVGFIVGIAIGIIVPVFYMDLLDLPSQKNMDVISNVMIAISSSLGLLLFFISAKSIVLRSCAFQESLHGLFLSLIGFAIAGYFWIC